MTAALRPEHFDALHDFIRLQVAAGYDPADQIVDEAVVTFAEAAGDVTSLRSAATAFAERAVAGQLAVHETWPEHPVCALLDAAFAELDTVGIVARHHFSGCGTGGVREIHDVLDQIEKAGLPARGF